MASNIDDLVVNVARHEARKFLEHDHARPIYITRHNAEKVLGVPWRTVRDWSRAPDFPRSAVIRRGKTLLLETEAVLRLLNYSNETKEAQAPRRDAAEKVLDEIIGPGMVRAV